MVVVPATAATTMLIVPESNKEETPTGLSPEHAPFDALDSDDPPALGEETTVQPKPATTGIATVRTAAPVPAVAAPSGPDFLRMADRAQGLLVMTAWIAVLVLVAVTIYVHRPTSLTPALPSDIATLAPSASGSQAQPAASSQEALNADAQQYIGFVQKIDLQRIGLITSFDQTLAGQLNPASGSSPTSAGEFSQSAQQLMTDFLAQKSPADCSNLSNTYFRLVQDQTQMIAKAGTSLAGGDVRGATSARDAASAQIVSDAQSADEALRELSDSQHIDEPFSIVADPNTANPPAAPPLAPTSSPSPSLALPAPSQPAPALPAQPSSEPAPVNG